MACGRRGLMYDCRMSSGSLTHCPTCTGDSSCVCACPTCDKTRAAAQRSTCADCGEPARGGFCGDGYCIVKTRTILVGLAKTGHKVRLRDGEPVITVSQAELPRRPSRRALPSASWPKSAQRLTETCRSATCPKSARARHHVGQDRTRVARVLRAERGAHLPVG